MNNVVKTITDQSSSLLEARNLAVDAVEWLEYGMENATSEITAIFKLPNLVSIDVIVWEKLVANGNSLGLHEGYVKHWFTFESILKTLMDELSTIAPARPVSFNIMIKKE